MIKALKDAGIQCTLILDAGVGYVFIYDILDYIA